MKRRLVAGFTANLKGLRKPNAQLARFLLEATGKYVLPP
jgi:hypothetical protein